MRLSLLSVMCAVLFASAAACSDSDGGSDPTSSGGTSNSGGTSAGGTSAGGSSNGGSTATGGTSHNGGSSNTGGMPNTGGSQTGGSAGCESCGALEECFNATFCVAKAVALPGGYSIDTTEVTRGQYAAWLATNPDPSSGQPSYCEWNDSFTPPCKWPPGDNANHPVVCVDWCDAHAYCQAVGKRLCGKIGSGANGFADFADAASSQWFQACSNNGQNAYPYGDTYADQTCNTYDAGEGATLPVATKTDCQSAETGYQGVFDLSGNVWEWEDSCDGTTGPEDKCRQRGGSYVNGPVKTSCDADGSDVRNFVGEQLLALVGFRCCS